MEFVKTFIYIFFIFGISIACRKLKQAKGNNSNTPTERVQHKEITSFGALEDKSNDWLAQQYKEEQRAKAMVSAMFQLKQEHKNHCDAYDLRAFHTNNCDANLVREESQKLSYEEQQALKERIKDRMAKS